METTIGKGIRDLLSNKEPMEPTDYGNIELTEEEAREALRKAKDVKAAKIREQEYWKKVMAPKEYPKPDHEELFEIAKRSALQAIPNYAFDEHNERILRMLSAYFSGSESVCAKYGLSLKKGISLNGPTGCGKTTIMTMFRDNPFQSYKVVPCRKVGYDFAEQGFSAIETYSKNHQKTENLFGHEQYGFCFDDLGGSKEERKRYGDAANPMEEVLLSRYDKGNFHQTHITTNLTADQVEEMYGPRVRSRMREMFNMISFDTKAPDRR